VGRGQQGADPNQLNGDFKGEDIMNRYAILAITVMLCGAAALGWVRPRASSGRAARRLERGRYLVEGPAHCFMCHSELDWSQEGPPPRPDAKGGGQSPFGEVAFPWLSAPNISPDPETGSGTWTDDQFRRAIRQGIGANGRTLFPMMPYRLFHEMSDEDVDSVIAYLRSVPPVRRGVTPSALPPPVKECLRPLPSPGKIADVDRSSCVKYGEYLTKIANCTGCHTPVDAAGAPIPGMDWAGGLNLVGPWGNVHSMNLTPDPSGIPHYTEDLFLKVIHTGNPGGRHLNPIMPWGYFKKMTDDDLKAIFAYLKTLKPVRHRIDNTSARAFCKVCGGTHGLGDMNR
jgi:mono/diheme cytochrome c family protein